jgi:hypothetical protein
MAALVSREIIIERVAQEAQWVVNQRMEKFRQAMHDSNVCQPFPRSYFLSTSFPTSSLSSSSP